MPTFVIRVSAPTSALPKIIRYIGKTAALVGIEVDGEPATIEPLTADQGGPGRPKKTARNAEMVALYEADPKANSSEKLAARYGISRERVCQILRISNSIGMAQERRAVAREALAEESKRIRDEAAASLNENLDRAVALCRDGMSMRQAAASLGFKMHSAFVNTLGARLRELGIPLSTGRHRDFSERRKRVLALSREGKSVPEIVRQLRSDGDAHINEPWVYNNVPEARTRPPRRKIPLLGPQQ